MLLSLRLSLFSLQCGPPKRVGRYEAAVASVIDDSTDRRRRRWETAAAMLEATTAERRRFDHRAHLARIVGVYVSETVPGASSSDTELLVAMQPDQGGRKMLFLSPANGRILGFIELETLTAHSNSMLPDDEPARNGEEAHGTIACSSGHGGGCSSVLRGMLVAEDSRGAGYARLFLAIWLRFCLRAGVTPTTSRINKPLMALTLVRLGFTPLRGRDRPGLRGKPGKKRKPRQRPLAVEVSVGSEGCVLLYCPLPTQAKLLKAGFSATELHSQRLVIPTEAPEPRGRMAHIRVQYAPPSQTTVEPEDGHGEAVAVSQLVHTPLTEAAVGGRLRLCASQGPTAGTQTPAQKAEILRVLTGRL